MKRILFLMLGLSLNGAVMAGSLWAPNNLTDDVNFLSPTIFGGGILSLFDDNNQNYSMPGLALNSFDTVNFESTGTGYTISNGSGDTTFLTDTTNFILGMSFDNGLSWVTDAISFELQPNKSYLVLFDGISDGGLTIMVDAMAVAHSDIAAVAVPEPSIIWLFSIGLFLVWLRYYRHGARNENSTRYAL